MARELKDAYAVARRAIDQAYEGKPVSAPEDIAALLEVPLFSEASALMIAAARNLSHQACNGKAEVHAQMSVNLGPCPRQCLFCAFAECNDVFKESTELAIECVVEQCRQVRIGWGQRHLLDGHGSVSVWSVP